MKKNRVNIALSVLMTLVGALILTFIMANFLNRSMADRQKKVSEEKLTAISEMLDEMNEKAELETAAFDELNVSKADAVAYMAQNLSDFAYTDEHMEELRQIIDVYNLLVIDREGNVVCSALKSPRDYSISRFNQLREVYEGDESSQPFTIEDEDISLRYYGARIDDNNMVVIVRDTAVLDEKISAICSLASTLNDVKVGQEGFVFATSPLDYTFLYYPEEDFIGKSAVAMGLDASLLEDGLSDYITINGEEYYCSTAVLDEVYITCAVPGDELTANRNATIAITLIIYIITAAVMILYAFFAGEDKDTAEDEEYSRTIVGRLFAITLVGAVCLGLMTYFMMTLFSLSRQSITNKHRLSETLESLKLSEEEADLIRDQFDESYVEKARLLGRIVEDMDEDGLTMEFMDGLAEKLDVSRIRYFDTEGNTIAASGSFWGLKLSDDPEDQTYEFRKILEGGCDELVQEPMQGDDGLYYQYIGVAIKDDDHRTIGLAQIGITPSLLETALASADLDDVLSDIHTGNDGFVFAVDSEDGIFTYYPDEELVGWEATSYGMNEDELVTGYNDFITVNNVKYYSISGEYGSNLIYVAVPMARLNDMSLPVALVACIFGLLWLMLLWKLLAMGIKEMTISGEADNAEDASNKAMTSGNTSLNKPAAAEMINVDRGDGKQIRTRSILSRFSSRGISWKENTPGQKVWIIFKTIIGIAAVALLIMLINADSIFSEDSLVHYILKGSWKRGLNIFALCQCLILIIAVEVISVLVRKLLLWLADKLGAKGVTMIRLLVSFVRLATFIGLIYACLSVLGADTSVLLTSAGILSLVVGLGANSLIKDILAGIMIVFEGTFQVGDIVTIGGFRGTVVEIGIRTTKVKEAGGNIKVFNNSNVGDVLNMTKDFSVVAVDMSIEYGEDLCYVENVLAEEFANIKHALPAIIDGPFYKGVSELGDNSVNIKIVAKCNEADRIQLDRDLKRELKLIFDQHNISIPYPQIVLNQPATDFHHGDELEHEIADMFSQKQDQLSKGVVSEQDSQA